MKRLIKLVRAEVERDDSRTRQFSSDRERRIGKGLGKLQEHNKNRDQEWKNEEHEEGQGSRLHELETLLPGPGRKICDFR